MKKILFISLCFFSIHIYSQDSLLLKEPDTLYIMIDSLAMENYVVKEYRANSNRELEIVYNILDSIQVKQRLRFIKKNDSIFRLGKLRGASGNCDNCFGLYFNHITAKNIFKSKKIKSTQLYLSMKKQFLEKTNVNHSDSLLFDRFVFDNLIKNHNPPNSRILLDIEDLSNKDYIVIDGSIQSTKLLRELIDAPIYIYILDQKINKEVFEFSNKNSKQIIKKTKEFYIFNEVHWDNINGIQ